MCEYCVKHGAGKKWYLQARNYLKNYNDDKKRKKFVEDFVGHFMTSYEHYLNTGQTKRMLDFDDPNFIYRAVMRWYFTTQHSGQVVPLEEAELIMELAGQIALVPCVCRMANAGVKKKLCMVFMHIPEDAWGHRHLQGERDIEPLEVEEAQQYLVDFADQGMVQTVWTFKSPHIGAVCNCDYPYCTAVRARKNTGVIPSLFKSEYIAQINGDCTMCKKCVSKCQFGALTVSASTNQMIVNEELCFGCGLCRNDCTRDAIKLIPRRDSLKARNMW